MNAVLKAYIRKRQIRNRPDALMSVLLGHRSNSINYEELPTSESSYMEEWCEDYEVTFAVNEIKGTSINLKYMPYDVHRTVYRWPQEIIAEKILMLLVDFE
jgi:hypothetical protein